MAIIKVVAGIVTAITFGLPIDCQLRCANRILLFVVFSTAMA